MQRERPHWEIVKAQKLKNLIAFKAEEERSLWLERNEQEGGNTIWDQKDRQDPGHAKACRDKDIEIYHKGQKFSENYSRQGSELLMPCKRKYYLRRYAEGYIELTWCRTELTIEDSKMLLRFWLANFKD